MHHSFFFPKVFYSSSSLASSICNTQSHGQVSPSSREEKRSGAKSANPWASSH